ncbi:MAG: hypothetical protein COV70_02000 [Parcubacteria group bacterium CG11_big_fil_rev_8_21_14_0_20_39_22]|nr:MAG: hypothetical protein COV70_02000 [Parcubacteria group bacterium CG11_big_fil_rev_8_21_14_0_20_39_22]
MDIKNLSIVRQSFANTVFTHKVQEVAAENAGVLALRVKIANISIVSFALLMLILQVANPSNLVFSYLGSGIAAGEIIFLIVQLTFNFEQIALAHKNSALKYMQLRDKYRGLIVDIMNEQISQNIIADRRNSLQAEYQVISDLAPQTGTKEYAEAQRRLHTAGASGGEHYTWSDAEIDQFLPQNLRLSSVPK